jgi:TRAP-type C4-dicarboxylate transport system permease small subunit
VATGLIFRISRIASVTSAVILIYVTVHTLLEITLRTLFSVSTAVVVEFAGYGLASMTFLALSDTMRAGTLVRVNVLLNFVPKGVRRALDVFCVASTFALTMFVTYFFVIDIKRSFDRGFQTDSVVPLPSWLPPIGVVVGLTIFAIDLLLHLVLILRGEVEIHDTSEG